MTLTSWMVPSGNFCDTLPFVLLPNAPRSEHPEVLFENAYFGLVLVSLKMGQRISEAEPAERLLTVADGLVRLRGPGGSFVLGGCGHCRLKRGEHWKIRALSSATISLFIIKESITPK